MASSQKGVKRGPKQRGAVVVKTKVNDAGLEDLLTAPEMRRHLGLIGKALVAHARPHTGVDTGALKRSMTWQTVRGRSSDGRYLRGGAAWQLVAGSNVRGRINRNPKSKRPAHEYAIHHWAPGRPGGPRADWEGTRPWSKAADELGIEFVRRDGGGYEV